MSSCDYHHHPQDCQCFYWNPPPVAMFDWYGLCLPWESNHFTHSASHLLVIDFTNKIVTINFRNLLLVRPVTAVITSLFVQQTIG